MAKHPCTCKKCRRLFEIRPQRPDQKYCRKQCQQARKNAWQNKKMLTDEDYRDKK